MTRKKDYYEILGVSRDASEKDIKAAYRKLARKFHPDVNPGDKQAEDRFKEIAEAFAVLSDKDQRAKYDQGGHDAFGAGFNPFAGASAGGEDFFRNFDVGIGDLSDLFRMFTGQDPRGRAGRGGPRRGEDIQFEVTIPFLDAARGTTLEIRVPRQAPCGSCNGQGTRPGSGETTCAGCGGSGQRVQRQGPLQMAVACPQCGGTGRQPGVPCDPCGGAGRRGSEENVKVRIPPGVAEGDRVRLAGKGNAGTRGGAAGDAFLVVHVESHPLFRRNGRDLQCDVPIGLAKSALGGTVQVPTLDGSASVQVPAGSRSGRKLRLRGRGIPANAGAPAGDLYAVLQIRPPETLDDRSRELLEEFAKLNPEGN